MEIIPICSGIHAKDCPFAQMAEKKHARGKKEQSEAGSRKEQNAGKKKTKEVSLRRENRNSKKIQDGRRCSTNKGEEDHDSLRGEVLPLRADKNGGAHPQERRKRSQIISARLT